MRNLKKFLALVLAMMMAMSLMVTVNAASGKDFADVNKINSKYTEAIEVLNALGVITGYGVDGGGFEYRPGNPIRRGEFAAILYRIHSGNRSNADMQAWTTYASDFKDVNPNDWWAGAIGYVNFNHLMKGDLTNFNPTGYITGSQVLVSLLRTLGLEEENEFSGTGWDRRAQEKAYNEQLLNVVTLPNLQGNATREQIAQLAYEALLWNKDHKTVTHYTLGGATVYETAEAAEAFAKKNGIPEGDIPTMMEQHITHPGSLAYSARYNWLHRTDSERDKFMRPTTTWKYGDESMVLESVKTPYAYYANGTFNGTEAKALLRDVKNDLSKITIYYNGDKVDATTGNIKYEDYATAVKNGEKAKALWIDDTTGKYGYEVWVYTNASGYDVIIREAYVAQITAATKAGNDITVELYDWTDGNTTGTGTEKRFPDATQTFTIKKSLDEDLYNKLAVYPDKAFVAVYPKADYMSYVDDGTKLASLYLLDVETMDTKEEIIFHIEDNVDNYRSNLLVNNGNTKYTVNSQALWTNDKDIAANVVNGANQRATQLGKATLHMVGGRVLLVEQPTAAAASIHYAYVLDYKGIDIVAGSDQWTPDYDNGGAAKLQLKLLLDNGEEKIITYKYLDGTTWKDQGFAKKTPATDPTSAEYVGEQLLNTLVEFNPDTGAVTQITNAYFSNAIDYDSNGTVEASPGNLADSDAYGVRGVWRNPALNGKLEIKQGVAEGKISEVSNGNIVADASGGDILETLVFDNKTTFFVVQGALSAKNKPNAKVDLYHGILDTGLPAKMEGDASKTLIQYVYERTTNRIVAILVRQPKGETTTVTNDYFILGYQNATLHKLYLDETYTDYIEYYELNAVVNGELTTVKMLPSAGYTPNPMWFSSVTFDDHNIIKATGTSKITAKTTINTPANSGLKWTVLNEVIKIKDTQAPSEEHSYVVPGTLSVWYFDRTTGSISALRISGIKETMTGYVDAENGKLNGLYLEIPNS